APEALLLEHARGAGERQDAILSLGAGHLQRRLDQVASDAIAAVGGVDRQRAHLAQVRVEVDQRDAAHDLTGFLGHQPVRDGGAHVLVAARQHAPGADLVLEQRANLCDFVQGGVANHQAATSARMPSSVLRNCAMWLSSTIKGGSRRSTFGPALIISRPWACPAAIRGATSMSNSTPNIRPRARISTMRE